MALFTCDYCGYEQSVTDDHLHRQARCPKCRRVSLVLDEPLPETLAAQHARNGMPPFVQRHWRHGLALLAGCLAMSAWHMAFSPRPASKTSVELVREQSPLDPARIVPTQQAPVKEAVGLLAKPVHAKPAAAKSIQPKQPPVETTASDRGWSWEGLGGSEPPVKNPQPEPPPVVPVGLRRPIPVAAKGRAAVLKTLEQKRREAGPQKIDDQIALGQSLFAHRWTPDDPLSNGGDGLGPVFNADSCVACHFQAGPGGSGTNAHNVQAFEVLPDRDAAEIREGVIHAVAWPGLTRETSDQLNTLLGSPKVPGRAKRTRKEVSIDAVRTVFLNTPALWGNGTIDRITDEDLFRLERDRKLTGRYRVLPSGQVGKFGWKSQTASLLEFVGGACSNEIGLSNRIRGQQVPQEYRENLAAQPDLTDGQVLAMVEYVAHLPAPKQVLPDDAGKRQQVEAGHQMFANIGCANCHVENVGPANGVYSDFRLHLVASTDIKSDVYYTPDITPVYQPPPTYAKLGEWKTSPLWGIADTAPYWHDGSAPTLRDAILKHDEEARPVRGQFESLGSKQQEHLLAFLSSLKAPADLR